MSAVSRLDPSGSSSPTGSNLAHGASGGLRDIRHGGHRFVWKGLDLRFGRRTVLSLVQDADYPHLYRIKYPNGWLSTPGNLTRAKDAAYGHARALLGED